MKHKIKSLYIVFLVLLPNLINAQHIIPINRNYLYLEQIENQYNLTSLKPFYTYQIEDLDSILLSTYQSNTNKNRNWIGRKFRTEHLFEVRDSNLLLNVDILFDFAATHERDYSSPYLTNTRGAIIQGQLGKNIFFNTRLYENQSGFPDYIDQFITNKEIVPGGGTAREFNNTDWDYNWAAASLSWEITKHFNLHFGNEKLFVGDGYRSLFLSDNTYPYPFVHINWNNKYFSFSRIYTQFIHFTDHDGIHSFPKKTGTFNYWGFTPNKYLQLSLFEGSIWQNPDTNNKYHFDLNYFNPFPFINTFNEENNTITGLNIKIKPVKNIVFYGQGMFDDFSVDKDKNKKGILFNQFGYQTGIKYFNFLNINNLYLQAEHNKVTPYTYAENDSTYSYSHYGQPLAHPIGSGFSEWLGILNYRYKSWYVQMQYNNVNYLNDSANFINNGGDILKPLNTASSNIFTSTTSNSTEKSKLQYIDIKTGYVLNPLTQMQIVAGITVRKNETPWNSQTTRLIYFAFKTSLENFYHDF